MNKSTFAIAVVAVSTAQICGATLPASVNPAAPGIAQSDLVDRGGTIDAIDAKKQILTVNGSPYSIPLGSVRIHTLSNHVTGSLSELHPGMQIRFSSITDPASGQIQAREIWVSMERAQLKR